jgi:DNA-3-methyladenine glycosylase
LQNEIDPRLLLPPRAGLGSPADRAFFERDTRIVARAMLGGWLVRRRRGRRYGARLVEVEAYLGARDAAAHPAGGRRTPRTEPMYAAGGHLYVYFVYGMHHCVNLVTGPAGVGQAVLLRAAQAEGAPPELLRGPAKLCKAFGLDRRHSGIDLVAHAAFDFYPDPLPRGKIAVSERIGVAYAGAAAEWKLRYFIKNCPAVSKLKIRAH